MYNNITHIRKYAKGWSCLLVESILSLFYKELADEYRYGDKGESMKRFQIGHIVILVMIAISFLVTGTSIAATMPDYVSLNSVTTKLSVPTAVAIDSHERIYVTESSKGELHVYTQSGVYVQSLVGLDRPISVAVDAYGNVLIGNKDTGNVEVYDSNLNLYFKLGYGDGEFVQPGSIAILGSKIFVADSGDNVIKKYNSDGTYDLSIGTSGSGDGEFTFPTGIAIDEVREELIVADRQLVAGEFGGQVEGVRIQVLDLNGNYKRSFGTFGVGEGLMQKPVGIAVDGEGRIYVADAMQHVVHVFDGSNGTSLGTIHDADNQMRTPLNVIYGASNRLFVTSMNTGDLKVFGLESSYVKMSTSPLSLTFSADEGADDPAAQSVTLTNSGTGTISWTTSADSSWITVSDSSGSTAVSDTSTLNIGVSLTGLSSGTYTGRVTISSGTAADIVTVNLTVIEIPPLVANAGEAYTAEEDETVTLNASYSSGRIALYEWDVNDDGTYEYSTTSATQSHTYIADGTYTVRLRISDAESATAEDTAVATISDSTPNADFTADTMLDTGPFTVNFINSSTGYDQALTYEWDFDEDGVIDSTLENPSYLYIIPAAYDVALTVTDSDGSTDTLTITNYITVNAGIQGCYISPVKKGVTLYAEVQNAYDAASDGDTIELQDTDMYADSLNISRDVTVTIDGGYNCDYTGSSGMTTINGNITITTGTLILGDIIIQ
jgi:PKD repeat protein